ncbi:MAG: hypothetical protein OEW80_06620, partial [Gemmatimonadota bacterium]|nr:hypothetical protein [Gemmatimonadota bacterium]
SGAEPYYWEDVALYAMLTGQWDELEEGVRAGLACQAHFESSGEPTPDDKIEAAAGEYRYERELITAAETEEWLESHGLTAGEWMGYVEREVLRAQCEDRLEQWIEDHPASPQEILDAMRDLWICADVGRELAEGLAEWVAAAGAEGVGATSEYGIGATGETLVGAGHIGESAEYRTLPTVELTEEETELAERLPGLDPNRLARRLSRLRRLQAAEAKFRSQVTTPEAVRREVEHHRLEWVRLHCTVAHFSTEAHAREAALCVREDGMSLEEVATGARAEVEDVRLLLSEVESDLRNALLPARSGDLVGPLRSGDQWALFAVEEKSLPALDDPDTAELAAREAGERAVREQVSRRIRWLVD